MLRLSKICRHCKKQTETCKKCTGCETAWYCSKQCQKDDWGTHKQSCGKSVTEDTLLQSSCKFCGNCGSGLKRCKGCMAVFYCSKPCQRIDWPDHKKQCKYGDKVTKPVETSEAEKENSKGSNCAVCVKPGCSLRCSRCKAVYYCTRDCQREDWKTHKLNCKKTEGAESEPRQQNIPERSKDWDDMQSIPSFFHWMFRPPEIERIVATKPPGALDKAKAMIRQRYLFTPVIDDLDDVPVEHPFPLLRQTNCVLVAFMFKYHPYARRHAIFIQDRKDEVTKVEFYLDFDNPFPFFSYSQVRPGNFLCLLNPLIHGFMDGTVGIRVDDPSDVTILDGRSLT